MTSLRLRYQTIEFGDTDIHVCTLRDNQQFSDPDGEAEDLGISSASWPLFGILWPSSLVLANHLRHIQTGGKRILEIGCGIGLSSLLLNKQNQDITATDYHPEVEQFLERNTRLNNDSDIAFERIDWSEAPADQLGRFDLMIGSDLLYEDQQIQQLADFIENHAEAACEIILVDPGRGRKNKLTRALTQYGFSNAHSKPAETAYLEKPFKGDILRFWRDS